LDDTRSNLAYVTARRTVRNCHEGQLGRSAGRCRDQLAHRAVHVRRENDVALDAQFTIGGEISEPLSA